MAMPTPLDRLAHIVDSIELVQQRTAAIDLAIFKSDRFLQLAVERSLEIISEATRHIPDDWKARHASIPWRRIADIGNRIRHSYHAVDSEIVWEIVRVELTELRRVIELMQATPPQV